MAERNNLKATIETRISALQASEKTTRLELGSASRELLMYVPESGDIGMVNRLLDVLTAHTRDYAVLYFLNFLPWKFEDGEFTTKATGDKTVAKKLASIAAFLSVENNNIWTWAKKNIQPAQRVIDYKAGVTHAIERALDKEKGKLTELDVIKAIIAVIPVGHLLKAADAMKPDDNKATSNVANPAPKDKAVLPGGKRQPVKA